MIICSSDINEASSGLEGGDSPLLYTQHQNIVLDYIYMVLKVCTLEHLECFLTYIIKQHRKDTSNTLSTMSEAYLTTKRWTLIVLLNFPWVTDTSVKFCTAPNLKAPCCLVSSESVYFCYHSYNSMSPVTEESKVQPMNTCISGN